jgi:hypothetical protein
MSGAKLVDRGHDALFMFLGWPGSWIACRCAFLPQKHCVTAAPRRRRRERWRRACAALTLHWCKAAAAAACLGREGLCTRRRCPRAIALVVHAQVCGHVAAAGGVCGFSEEAQPPHRGAGAVKVGSALEEEEGAAAEEVGCPQGAPRIPEGAGAFPLIGCWVVLHRRLLPPACWLPRTRP